MTNDVDGWLLAKVGGVQFQHSTAATLSQASTKKRSRAKPSTAIDLIQPKESDKDSESEEDDELREVEGPSASKKTKTTGSSSDEPRLTIYPIILKPCPPVMKYRKNKIPPPEEVVKSPFFITFGSSMNNFLELLANRLNTAQSNINKDQIQWKPEKPKNAQRKPLVDEDGFSAMLTSIRGSKRDAERIVNVYLPPPKIPESAASDDKNDDEEDNKYQYAQTNMLLAQKSNIDKATAPNVRLLEAEYPIGNNPSFPGKRIYEANSRFWELTPIRLQVWAIAISDDRATLKSPPTSTHFDIQHCIRPPTACGDTAAQSANAAMQPAPMGYNPGMPPAVHGNMLPFPPTGYPGYPGMYPYSLPPYYLPNTLSLPLAAPPTPSVEIITLPRSISLNEFCQFYKISDSDQEKLRLLEVELGDRRCEELGEEDWKNDAKFSKLGWERFKEKHARFCEDVKNGVWN